MTKFVNLAAGLQKYMIYNKLILPVFQIDEVSGGKLKSGEIIKEIVKGVLPGYELCESTKKQLAPEQTLV